MKSLWQRLRIRLWPPSDPVLAALILLARREDPLNRAAFYNALGRSMLYIATTAPIDETKDRKNKEKLEHSLSLKILKDESGAMILPAFTGTNHFLKWYPEGSPYVGLMGQSLMELFLRQKTDLLAINPAGPVWCTLDKKQITEALLQLQGDEGGAPASRTDQSKRRNRPANPDLPAKHRASAQRKKKKRGS
ncbi:MAG: SseB family protein [Spirochaetales bacterium]|nr:SseB family protein [Spirochaetales bacterium]